MDGTLLICFNYYLAKILYTKPNDVTVISNDRYESGLFSLMRNDSRTIHFISTAQNNSYIVLQQAKTCCGSHTSQSSIPYPRESGVIKKTIL